MKITDEVPPFKSIQHTNMSSFQELSAASPEEPNTLTVTDEVPPLKLIQHTNTPSKKPPAKGPRLAFAKSYYKTTHSDRPTPWTPHEVSDV
jgi:hypothetical protein